MISCSSSTLHEHNYEEQMAHLGVECRTDEVVVIRQWTNASDT